jgi:hypothetical protein
MNVWWKGAHRGCERAQWIGDKMSFSALTERRRIGYRARGRTLEKDDAGYERKAATFEKYEQVLWWKTDLC